MKSEKGKILLPDSYKKALAAIAAMQPAFAQMFGEKEPEKKPVFFKKEDATLREKVLAYLYQEKANTKTVRSSGDWGDLFGQPGRNAHSSLLQKKTKKKTYKEPNEKELQHVIELLNEDIPARRLAQKDLDNL